MKATLPLLFLAFAITAPCSLSAAPSDAAQERKFLEGTRQLTYDGKRSGEGYFSPDGKSLIFQSEREPGNPFYQIYLLNLESGDSHRVSPGIGKTTCAFFQPETDQVLFASTHLDPEAQAKQKAEIDFRAAGKQRRYAWDYDDQMEIFLANRDGSDLRRLTDSPGYDAEASWSPNGEHIVFCSLRSAYPTNALSADQRKRFETDPSFFGEIYIMNADGSDQRRLTFTGGYDGGPFFSPDGARIIWRRFDESGTTADVYSMKTDGSDVRRLTRFGAMSWAPYYHPSGKYFIFTSNKLGFSNFELYLCDADGTHEPVRVTYSDGFDGLPVFSPNGHQLCWSSGRTSDGKTQLFMAKWNDAAALASLNAAPPAASATIVVAEARMTEASQPVDEALHAEIDLHDLEKEIGYLASPRLEGRMTGSPGAQMASEYIADYFKRFGIKPLSNFFQPFEFTSGVRVLTNQNRMTLARSNQPPLTFVPERDFRPLSFTANGAASGAVVFAGYGLSVPGKNGYDSYAGVNVSNKIALILRYVPEDVEPKRRQELNRYAGLRYKAMLAREHGATAVLFVTGPTSPDSGKLASASFDSSLAGSGIVALSVTTNVAQSILSTVHKDLRKLQSDLDNENPHAESGFTIDQVRLDVTAAVEQVRKMDRNVLGIIPGTGSEYVLIGAHYDHLGRGEVGAFERKGEENQIHFGADDNASGTAAVLELAAAAAHEQSLQPRSFKRALIVALWSGEEVGLIGSSYFAAHPLVPLSNIVAYLNFDMVGRLNDDKLTLQGLGSSAAWRRLIEKRNIAAGFNLSLQDDPYLPTDVTAFYPKHIPVLSFFTSSHDDYHRPTDTPDKINYAGLTRIATFAKGLLADLLQSTETLDYVAVTRNDSAVGSRENLRAYLGTIPDYAVEVKGVKLSGVRGGSPAEKAGLQSGDIIVEFGGQKIANIYDYTFALDSSKIGQPVIVVVQRKEERVRLTVTPEVRK
jgi:Tol biopolymer transport system component